MTLTWNGSSPGSATAAFVSNDGAAYTFAYTVGTAEPEGPLSLHADLISLADVPNTYDQPNVLELDFTPPVLVPGTNVIQLAPPATSLRADVTAATAGTAITALFAANETLTSSTVVTTLTPATIPFACDPPLGTFYTCRVTVDATMTTQGDYALVANVSDLAGNLATLQIGPFTIDTIAPVAPLNTAGSVVLNRVPHGGDGVPQTSIAIAPSTVEAGVAVFAWDHADVSTGSPIARATAAADGSLASFMLPGVDRKTIYVQSVDKAGNPSVAVHVLDGTWTATLGGKVAGDTFDNPNRLLDEQFFFASRDQVIIESQSPMLLAKSDGQLLTTSGGPSWSVGPSRDDVPSARAGCRMTHDDLHGQQILFGGWWSVFDSGNGVSDETWSFDGYNWARYPLEVRPPARSGHALVYDKARSVVVLFGGCGNGESACTGTRYGDTWTFDGASWTESVLARMYGARVHVYGDAEPARKSSDVLGFGTWRGRPLWRKQRCESRRHVGLGRGYVGAGHAGASAQRAQRRTHRHRHYRQRDDDARLGRRHLALAER